MPKWHNNECSHVHLTTTLEGNTGACGGAVTSVTHRHIWCHKHQLQRRSLGGVTSTLAQGISVLVVLIEK